MRRDSRWDMGLRRSARFPLLLLALAVVGLDLWWPIPCSGQTPDWVPEDREIAPDLATFRGEQLNILFLWVSTRASQIANAQGEYDEPWTRVYALKDHYDFGHLLQLYPHLRFTIALSPALLDEIEAGVKGYDQWKATGRPGDLMPGCDRWLRLSLVPVEKMKPEERLFVAENFFRILGKNVASYHAGLRRLVDLAGGAKRPSAETVLSRLGEGGLRDLAAWFNLAAFDPDFLAEKITLPGGEKIDLTPYVRKAQGFTDADIAAVIDIQMKVLRSLVPLYQELRAEGRLELATSPYYDPILPLLADPEVARTSSPKEKRAGLVLPPRSAVLAKDAEAQLAMAARQFKRLFGDPAPGLWLGSGGAEQTIVSMVPRLGFAWVAADQNALRATTIPERVKIGERKRYSMYEVQAERTRIPVFFEDPYLVEDFVKVYSTRSWLKAANIFLTKIYQQHVKRAVDPAARIVPVVLPLDAGWESFDNDGKDFLHSFFNQIAQCPWANLVTPSSFLAMRPTLAPVKGLSASVSATHLYLSWIGAPAQVEAWRELARARQTLEEVRGQGIDAQASAQAERLLLRAEGRDILAGLGHPGPEMAAADARFRDLLSRAYQDMGRAAPAAPPKSGGPSKSSTRNP